MAIWQFEVLLLPADAVRTREGTIPPTVPATLLDVDELWGGAPFEASDRAWLDSALPADCSSYRGVLCWGTDQGNRVSVVVRGRCIEEMSVRIDVRRVDDAFLRFTCALADRWGCVFLFPDYRVIPSMEGELRAAIAESDAARFVADSEGFLDDLRS